VIGVLLAETKLSNRGLGYLVIQRYTTFDMPGMYALLIVVFLLAIAANALLTRWSGDAAR
jgi:ABC-type nitrate/sulfonate/bicarbonate transport system permease component